VVGLARTGKVSLILRSCDIGLLRSLWYYCRGVEVL
jgi:hypothetical protein